MKYSTLRVLSNYLFSPKISKLNLIKSLFFVLTAVGLSTVLYGCNSGKYFPLRDQNQKKFSTTDNSRLLNNIGGSRGIELRQAEFIGYHLANQAKNGSTVHALNQFWTKVKDRTNGKLNMTVLYKDANLPGSDGEGFLNTSSGRFDAITVNSPAISNVIPQILNIMTLMFAFDDSDEGLALVHNKTFQDLLVESGKKFNVTFLPNAMLNAGTRVVTSNSDHPFSDINNIQGFKLRIPPSKSISKQLKALGVDPIITPIGQIIQTLKSNNAYGQENPPSYIKIFKINTVQNIIWKTNHLWSAFVTAINTDTWNSWPAEWQEIVQEEAILMQKSQWKNIKLANQNALSNASQLLGMEVRGTNFDNISDVKEFDDAREKIVASLEPKLQPIAEKIIRGRLPYSDQ